MCADRRQRRKARLSENRIRAFFAPGQTERSHLKAFRLIRRLAGNDRLLEQICLSFFLNCGAYDPTELELLNGLLLEIIHERIGSVPENAPAVRCLLLRCIQLCNLHSAQIDAFRARCAAGSPLEQLWASAGPLPVAPPKERSAASWN